MTQAPSTLVDDLTTIRRWTQGAPGVALPEIDTINVIIGDGATAIVAGVAAALRVDFNAYITGGFLHEFDGITGSVSITIARAAYVVGSAPTFTSIVGSAPLMISSSRYAEDLTLVGWTPAINRGDVLRFSVSSATSITRVLVALRVRRLEP
jgi:hypothetical protein